MRARRVALVRGYVLIIRKREAYTAGGEGTRTVSQSGLESDVIQGCSDRSDAEYAANDEG